MSVRFSAPEPKAQVHYCDHAISVVHSSLTFYIFDFSETTDPVEQNSTETLQEGRTQHLLPSSCFSGQSKKRWPPWLLIGRDIFGFSSETTERNSTDLDRQHDLIRPLPTLCFSGRLEMAALVSDWLRHFPLLLYNRWTEFHSVTLSIDQTLHQFFNPITDLDLIIEFDFLPNCETFPTFATGAACQQRTLTHQDTWSSPTLGLASVLMLRPISSELVLLPCVLSFGHPSVPFLNYYICLWSTFLWPLRFRQLLVRRLL